MFAQLCMFVSALVSPLYSNWNRLVNENEMDHVGFFYACHLQPRLNGLIDFSHVGENFSTRYQGTPSLWSKFNSGLSFRSKEYTPVAAEQRDDIQTQKHTLFPPVCGKIKDFLWKYLLQRIAFMNSRISPINSCMSLQLLACPNI